jgi:hypothetical protein
MDPATEFDSSRRVRFSLRDLLLCTFVVACGAALFVYLPWGNALPLAMLLAVGAPLTRIQNPTLEGLFWTILSAKTCYHLGLVLSMQRLGWIAYAAVPICWVIVCGVGLRRQPDIRRSVVRLGLLTLIVAECLVPEDSGIRDGYRIDHELFHWTAIAILTALSGFAGVFMSSRLRPVTAIENPR